MYISFDYNDQPSRTAATIMKVDGDGRIQHVAIAPCDGDPIPLRIPDDCTHVEYCPSWTPARRANMEWMKRSQCTWPFRMRGTGTRERKFALKHRTPFGMWLIDYYKKLFAGRPAPGRVPKYLKKLFRS